jgi:cobyrinic acid a,c-diamide synthase
MGLFDGTPSSADLAQLLGVPVLAVIDAESMAQSFGAIAHGLASYRAGLPFYGVLANRVAGARHAELLQQGMRAESTYLGAVMRDPGVELPDRHLGLVQAEEVGDLEQRLNAAAATLKGTGLTELPPAVEFAAPEASLQSGSVASEDPPQSARVGLEEALQSARVAAEDAPRRAPSVPEDARQSESFSPRHASLEPGLTLAGVRIGIARDRAFSFLYPANLDLLRALGAELVFFSPLVDGDLPPVDSVYLPGGYPELHLPQLSANRAMALALRRHVDAGRPLYAECGGMLYLLESLTDVKGQRATMAGVLAGSATMQPRLRGLGYQSAPCPGGGALRGHTFHHSAMETSLLPWAHGERVYNTSPGEAIYREDRLVASYLHTYFPSNPQAAAGLFRP